MNLSDELRFDYLDRNFQLGNLHALYTGILEQQAWAVLDYYKMQESEIYQPALEKFHELYPSLKEPSLELILEDIVIPEYALE